MKNLFTLTFVIILYFNSSLAQTASFNININNINATVLNGGDLFNAGFRGNETFEVPKGSNKKTIFAAGLWIGGMDAQHKLHLAACTYRQSGNDFEPGPVSDSAYQTKQKTYDKIFYITQKEIDYHLLHLSDLNYIPSEAISTWPGNGKTAKGEVQRLAPFIDINKNNIYDPLLGDYPLIPGDACAFTIFNDNLPNHEALKVEIHQFVYGYDDPASVLNNTLFVTYKIFNRSANNYEDMYLGQWIDYDIGNYSDDAICADTVRNLMYAYNWDDNDEGIKGYGLNPPAMGCLFLNQKLYRNVTYYNDFSIYGNPQTPQHYYNYLKGFYKNNQSIPPINCFFNNTGGGDGRSLGSTGPFFLPSNSSYCFTVAHLFARASSGGAQGSVDLLKQSSDFVQKYFNNKWIDDGCEAYSIANGITKSSKNINKLNVYPNPAMGKIIVNCKLLMVKNTGFNIINTLGQTLLEGMINDNETEIDVSSLGPGVYFINAGQETVKFVKE